MRNDIFCITRIAKIGTLHRNLNKWWCIIFVLNDCISFVTNIIALPSNSSLWDFNETQRFRAHLILTFRLRNWKKFIQCNSVTTTIRSPWDMVIWVICWIAQINDDFIIIVDILVSILNSTKENLFIANFTRYTKRNITYL